MFVIIGGCCCIIAISFTIIWCELMYEVHQEIQRYDYSKFLDNIKNNLEEVKELENEQEKL